MSFMVSCIQERSSLEEAIEQMGGRVVKAVPDAKVPTFWLIKEHF